LGVTAPRVSTKLAFTSTVAPNRWVALRHHFGGLFCFFRVELQNCNFIIRFFDFSPQLFNHSLQLFDDSLLALVFRLHETHGFDLWQIQIVGKFLYDYLNFALTISHSADSSCSFGSMPE
jgi:hypothetical protein